MFYNSYFLIILIEKGKVKGYYKLVFSCPWQVKKKKKTEGVKEYEILPLKFIEQEIWSLLS